MRRIKKTIKKYPKKLVVSIMLLVMVFSCIAPLSKVIASSYGEGENFINMGLDNELGFTINSVTINGATWNSSLDEFHTNDNKYHIEIIISGNETTGDKIPKIEYGGNWNDYIKSSTQHNENNHTFVLDLTDTNHQGFLGLSIKEDSGEQGHGDEPHFDGKAYVLWSCGTGVCYHYFDNIPSFDDGNSKFYKNTDVTADNDTSIVFDVKAEYKAWTLPGKFNRWKEAYKEQNNLEDINWSQVNPEDIIGENPPRMDEWEANAVAAYNNNHETGCKRPNDNDSREEREQFEKCVDEYYIAAGNLPFIRLQPVGEPNDNNAYVSYGDRNFKVVIYNSDFKGITMGDLSKLNYYPAEWTNPFIRRDQFDISGTTKSKPTLLNSILLESTVRIKTLNYNEFEIASIEALDVPQDAVKISKEDDEFKLEYSSNFYDNVVFKVTDTKGEVSYMQIKRYTIDGWIRNDDNNPLLIADFYFDKEKTYQDFNLTAKIIYKDGTSKNVALEASYGIDDGLGNITDAYEIDESNPEFGEGGKGLKRSVFTYSLETGEADKIEDIYLNAEYKGSTEYNYAGAYVGSGEGVPANIYHGEEE